MMAVHELGHLLARYPEYYTLKHSVNVAPRGLGYYDWYRDIVNNPSERPPEDPNTKLKWY